MDNLFNLKDELIILTGGTGTIGKAFCKALVDAGAKVILWSRGKTVPIEETVEEMEKQTNTKNCIFAYKVDVSDKKSVEKGLEDVVRDLGIPTVFINGAGGNKGKSSFIDADLEIFEEVLKLNLLGGLMIPTQVIAAYWIKNKLKGSIINLASAASYIPLSGVWAYDAAKSAVMNLTMGAAKEFAPFGIRVNGIAPGFFIGHQNRNLLYSNYEKKELSDRGTSIINHTPYGRFGNTSDLYGAVIFLASEKASGFITGVTIPVDGGYLIDNI